MSKLDGIEYYICDTGHLWRKAYSEAVKDLGITTNERRLLIMVNRHPSESQVMYAQYLDIEPQNLLKIIDKLETQKCLKRVPCPKDRRKKLLVITQKGQEYLNKVEEAGNALRPVLTQGLSQKELKQLKDYLQRIQDNMNRSSSVNNG